MSWSAEIRGRRLQPPVALAMNRIMAIPTSRPARSCMTRSNPSAPHVPTLPPPLPLPLLVLPLDISLAAALMSNDASRCIPLPLVPWPRFTHCQTPCLPL
ncbi:hypothetical protein ACJQWK_10655 [Exserohilum turcicum]